MGKYVDALMEKNSLYLRFLFAEIINRGKNMGLDVNDFNLTQCLLILYVKTKTIIALSYLYGSEESWKSKVKKNMNQIHIIYRNHLDIV